MGPLNEDETFIGSAIGELVLKIHMRATNKTWRFSSRLSFTSITVQDGIITFCLGLHSGFDTLLKI